MIKIQIDRRSQKVLINTIGLGPIVEKSIHTALFEIGSENVKYAQDLMLEKKTGRIYIIKGEEHQASAPGEAPAILSGDLQRNVDYTVRSSKQMSFGDKSQAGKNPYGKYLEESTIHMESIPHIERTVIDRQKETFNSLVHHSKKGINEIG